MAKSALLKSSIAKKYWVALTGLFLCLFLAGHLAGNLQLLVPNNALNFNQYALFMTSNPAVKLLSYLTYISILFHAIDGIALTIQNKKAKFQFEIWLFYLNIKEDFLVFSIFFIPKIQSQRKTKRIL